MIPLALAAARDATAIKVFGNDYDTTDGTCIRDYVHMLDITDAHVRALKYLIDAEQAAQSIWPTSEATRYWKSWRRPSALLENRSKSSWCQDGPAIRRSRSALSKEREPCWLETRAVRIGNSDTRRMDMDDAAIVSAVSHSRLISASVNLDEAPAVPSEVIRKVRNLSALWRDLQVE